MLAAILVTAVLTITAVYSALNIKGLEKDLGRVRKYENNLKEEVMAANRAADDLKREFETEKEKLESAIKSKEDENIVLYSKATALEQKLKKAEEQVVELENRIKSDKDAIDKEKEEVRVSFEKIQERLQEKSRKEFNNELTGLSTRLATLSRNRKAIESKWSEAMNTIESMEEAARNMEESLAAKGVGANEAPSEEDMEKVKKLTKLKGDIEQIRKAMSENMSREIEMIDSESVRINEELDGMYVDLKMRTGKSNPDFDATLGKRPSPEANAPMNLGLINKKLEGLKTLAVTVDESPMGPGLMNGKFETYIVKKGDTLWSIASRENTYGNPKFWPVIYKYNSQQIKKPDFILPNDQLFIFRGQTADDAANAATGTKDSIFPGIDKNDPAYKNWLKQICQ